ncbi:MAG: YybS family protein, partial [Syntrophaceae bacterium]|nr:YybS family protein [Syntrophaceae bacterium]
MDSAMIRGIAILALTLLVIAWVPWTGPVILILTPLPLVYTFQELGRKKGWLALGAAYILVLGGFQLLDIPRPLAVFLIGLGGALFAEVLRRRYAFDKTVWVASLALFLSVFGLLEGYALANGTSIGSLVGDYFEALITDNIELYRQMNFSPEQLKLIEANKSQITGFIVGIFPSLVLNGMILTVWLNILI